MLNLRKDFKVFPVKTGENHSRIGVLMVHISFFIYSDSSGKSVNSFKFVKRFIKCIFKTHSVCYPCHNFGSSGIAYNIFSHPCTAHCTESIGIISRHRGRI